MKTVFYIVYYLYRNPICQNCAFGTCRPVLRYFRALFLVCLLLSAGCGRKHIPPDQVLFTVGDKTITVNEYLERAELAVRPFYCKSNTEKSKRIILNTLVAEKLLAARPVADSLQQNPRFLAHIQGIREQVMRRQLYEKLAATVKIDSQEVIDNFYPAGTTCTVHYYRLKDRAEAAFVEDRLDAGEPVFDNLMRDRDIPVREIKWQDNDVPAIQKAFLGDPLEAGQIVGPVDVGDGTYLLCRVVAWQYTPAVGPEQVQLRNQTIREHLFRRKAENRWRDYQRELMAGKKPAFYQTTFNRLVDIFAHEYIGGRNEMEQEQLEADTTILKYLKNEDELLVLPFFKIDGRVWTVEDFKKEVWRHPLVYLNKNFQTKDEFKNQFIIAVDDLVRDHFLTKAAYTEQLDTHPEVVRIESMWRDAYRAKYSAAAYLKSLPQQPDWPEIMVKYPNKYLSRYCTQLLKQNRSMVRLNTEKFDDIKLTRIDMLAVEPYVPFPLKVPRFPHYCAQDTLWIGG